MRFSSASFLSHGRLYNSPLFDHPDINWCWVKNHQVSHCALVSSRLLPSALLVPSSFLSTLFSNIFSLCFSLTWETKFHTRTKRPAIVLCILRVIRTFLGVTKGPVPTTSRDMHQTSVTSNLLFISHSVERQWMVLTDFKDLVFRSTL